MAVMVCSPLSAPPESDDKVFHVYLPPPAAVPNNSTYELSMNSRIPFIPEASSALTVMYSVPRTVNGQLTETVGGD